MEYLLLYGICGLLVALYLLSKTGNQVLREKVEEVITEREATHPEQAQAARKIMGFVMATEIIFNSILWPIFVIRSIRFHMKYED